MMMMRMIKCRQCGKEVEAGKSVVETIGKRKIYFCNEEDKNLYLNQKDIKTEKEQCYEVIVSITNRGITVVYKVLKNLNNTYSWDQILEALIKAKPYLEKCYKEKPTDYAFAKYIEVTINNTYNGDSNKLEKIKYYTIKNSKKLAMTLSYIIDQEYKEFDDKFNEGWKCYSFIETEKLLNALEDIKLLKEKYEESK
jgi:hypothetical protein